jgi:hypothetical protein
MKYIYFAFYLINRRMTPANQMDLLTPALAISVLQGMMFLFMSTLIYCYIYNEPLAIQFSYLIPTLILMVLNSFYFLSSKRCHKILIDRPLILGNVTYTISAGLLFFIVGLGSYFLAAFFVCSD